MITERYMQPGQYTVPLTDEAPQQLLEQAVEFGHVVVMPQWVQHPARFSDADLLTAARYAGPVLETVWDGGGPAIRGQGMVWHLGDEEGKGPILETVKSFTAASISTVFDQSTGILPAAVKKGTITGTGAGTYTGDFGLETPLSAARTVCKTLDVHFRCRPDGYLDASLTTREEVYRYTPVVVAVRRGWGEDPMFKGLPVRRASTTRDAIGYATRSLVVDVADDGSEVTTQAASATHTYKDMHGNPLERTMRTVRPAAVLVDAATWLTGELAERSINDTQEVDTDKWELVGGSLTVGDMFWVYDPPSGLVDPANQIRFRGDLITPKRVRCLEADWPLVAGMGVYYRPSGAAITSANWTDLTRWVAWEATGDQES